MWSIIGCWAFLREILKVSFGLGLIKGSLIRLVGTIGETGMQGKGMGPGGRLDRVNRFGALAFGYRCHWR